jgi:AcrR family transcriptional regulator
VRVIYKSRVGAGLPARLNMETNKLIDRILESARDHFFKFGFSRVTTDEISSGMGISKKTLYKHFPGKHLLLRAVVMMFMSKAKSSIELIVNDPNIDTLVKLKQVTEILTTNLSRINRPFLEDIQKHAPEIWKEMSEFRKKAVLENLGKLVEEGFTKGLFRKDIDKDFFITVWLGAIQNTVNPEFLTRSPYSANQVFDMLLKIVTEGVMTDDARKKYIV